MGSEPNRDPQQDDATRDALRQWLEARLPGAKRVTIGAFERPKSGFSAETLIFEAQVEGDGTERPSGVHVERFVLRKEVPDPAVYPQQAPGLDVEIDIQYRTMAALAAHGTVPVAPLVGYEADPAVLGAPFFVMGHVAGDVPTESPPYTETGFFVDASPKDRRRMIEAGVRTLAELHTIDWRAAGFDWLVPDGVEPGTRRQLEVWESYARRELRGREHPLLDDAFAWLHDNLPEDTSLTLCWGDPRPGNIIWRDFRPMCLTDFEAVSIATPEQDLGWWLMFDRTMHPNGERLPGDPTREEQRDIYAEATGRDLATLPYHEVFAAARYSAIVVRVMNRLVDRGDLAPDQTIWLHNPASACLAELMEELA
ncbi:MAG TPA: phosphotransferase family protein [Acidimicrobiales bacterium]